MVAQTTHQVAVTDYQFTPKDLTIEVGDIVVWTNTGTMGHNVNGTQTTFPNNPESFGNNVGLAWTFEHTFNTAGSYDYHCDPHFLLGMTGTVTVNPATAIDELAGESTNFRLYPNPASQYIDLLISGKSGKASLMKVYSIVGALIDEKVLPSSVESYRYDLSGFKNGAYFIEINSGNTRDVLKFLKQ